jgi:predicted DNA-binding protein
MKKSDYMQIRISPELKARLKLLAEADNRTVSSYVETLIKREAEKYAKLKQGE